MPKKFRLDERLNVELWVSMLIRAVEEDLARQVPKCANECCTKIQPKHANKLGWKRRTMMGHKRWLCEACSKAYDLKQYCEYCMQIYLKSNLEYSGLDGKEWAQCESSNSCSRWVHVDCLGEKYKIRREEVVAESFKYICCGCKSKKGGIKRPRPEN